MAIPPSSTPPKAPTDEVGAAIHAIVTILGAAGVVSALGLTADQVAVILGGLMTVAGIVRAWWLRTHPPALAVQPAPRGDA